MGKASGTLIVAQPLDSEQKSNYNLTVEATDGTRTVSTQVNEPRLKSLVVMVAFTSWEDGESVAIGSEGCGGWMLPFVGSC